MTRHYINQIKNCPEGQDIEEPKLFGDRIKIEKLNNPSDIHWEFKQRQPLLSNKRFIFQVIICIIIFMFSMGLISWMQIGQ